MTETMAKTLDEIKLRHSAVDPETGNSFKVSPADEFSTFLASAYGDVGVLLRELDRLSAPASVSEETVERALVAWHKYDGDSWPFGEEFAGSEEAFREQMRAALVASAGGDASRIAYLERRCASAEDAMQNLAEGFPDDAERMTELVMPARAHWERYAPESPSADAEQNAPPTTAGDGWQPIETLTEEDGQVIGGVYSQFNDWLLMLCSHTRAGFLDNKGMYRFPTHWCRTPIPPASSSQENTDMAISASPTRGGKC